jgi:hypothetical protein
MIEPPRETMPVTRRGQRHVGEAHAGVDGEVVDALLALLDQRVAEDFPVELDGIAVDLLERLIDRHGADRHGELRMIQSRMLWMLRPVERSITVSAPQRIDQTSFSTSSSTEEVTAELPILALIFTRKLRPMITGSSSGG